MKKSTKLRAVRGLVAAQGHVATELTVRRGPVPVGTTMERASIERSPGDGSTIDTSMLRLIGEHKRVLLAGRETDALGRALADQGCHVSNHGATGERKLANLRFDVIALRGVPEHVDNPVTLLAGFRRHLNSDGFVVASIPNITHGSVRLRFLSGHAPDRWLAPTGSTPRFCDASSVKALFDRAGFVITRLERHTEDFEDEAAVLNGRPLPPELLAELMRDVEARTSAFIVVAHKFPLTTRVLVDIRVNDLARTLGEQQHLLNEVRSMQSGQAVQHQRVDDLEQRLVAVADQMNGLRQATDGVQQFQTTTHLQLQAAYRTLIAGGAECAAVTANLNRLSYDLLVPRVRAAVEATVPEGAVILVVSKGDQNLVDLPGRTGWHFLQTAAGEYAGHHPADSAAAIDELEVMRAKGAGYLVFPRTALWWLGHYAALTEHLNERFAAVRRDERVCVIYSLREPCPPR